MKLIIKVLLMFLALFGAIIVVGLFFSAISKGVLKGEIAHCLKLEAQSKDYHDSRVFYITQWEKEMCDIHGVYVNAPVGLPNE
jgi:hypothetical protein